MARKRYTEKKKQEIVAFVHKVNSEKKRGGVTAATKKYNVSPITVKSWIDKEPSINENGKLSPIHRMLEIVKKLDPLKEQVAALEKEYEELKKRI